MSLGQVSRYDLDANLVDLAESIIQARGRQGREVGFYLAGKPIGTVCTIDTLCIPRQEATTIGEGCSLTIRGTEVTRLGILAERAGRRFCGQLHSHPGEAYHSTTDDEAPAMRFDGALSIVVPHFARHGLLAPGTAIFRFIVALPGWRPMDQETRREGFRLVDTSTFQVIGHD